METLQNLESTQSSHSRGEFAIGTSVIYPSHGRCIIRAIESRNIDGNSIQFYRLEIQRSIFSRSNKQDPSIWIPVSTAVARGLREPITREQAEALFEIFASREYFYLMDEPWQTLLPKMESAICKEGAVGLAKAHSFFHVLNRKAIHVPTPVARFDEMVHKFLYRELSDALEQPIKSLEEQLQKLMRKKLLPDS